MRRFVPWWPGLAVLAAAGIAIPIAALADAGSSLPDMPRFVRPAADGGLEGDATGFYEGAREFMAAWGRMPRAVFAADVLFVIAAAVALVVVWRRRPAYRPWLYPAAAFTLGVALAVEIHWMRATGAAVIGWPIVWSIPMFPVRVLGTLGPAAAWDIAVALSLLFVALTVIAVAYLGRNATRSSAVGLLAAACWVGWPLLVGLIAGHHAWTNDQWFIGVGLHGYDEPLSTLLVTAGAALLLSPRVTSTRLALAGIALSYATSVKVSNALVVGIALVLIFVRGRVREAVPFLAGAVAFVPVVLVYWPKSYPKLYGNASAWPHDPFDVGHVVSSWTHSSIFTPHTLAIVVPLAVVGAFGLERPWETALVLAFLLVNPVFYSFFANTPDHPRFLYASLPELFVLWAAGAALLLGSAQVLVRLHVEPHREQRELRPGDQE